MSERRGDPGESSSSPILFVVCSSLIAASLGVWLFALFPLMGHDYSYWVPLIYETRVAWSDFGTLAYDFSPLRCLGLPSFASPNSLLFSVQHALSLLGSDLFALAGGIAVVFAFSLFGARRLFGQLGLSEPAAWLLASGWCLQGWACARVVAGHLPFVQFLLAPWVLSVLISGRAGWVSIFAAAFWLAHTLYSGAFYSFVFIVAGCAMAVLVLRQVKPVDEEDVQWKDVARNAAWILGLSSAMVLPKILAVMDFMALFPREAELAVVPIWKAAAFPILGLTLPVPLPYNDLLGFSFGSWESQQFLYPGLFFVLLVVATLRRHELRVGRQAAIALAALVCVSAILTSGVLRDVMSALPFLGSMHVNPRWNAVILLPLAALAARVVAGTRFLEGGRASIGFWVLLGIFVLVPLQFVDKSEMRIGYLYHDDIAEDVGRVDDCYEPIFGYGLERFHQNPNRVDWLADELRDPRCMLESYACDPGQPFERAEDRELLAHYALENDHSPMPRLPSLVVYGVGFAAALLALGGLVREAWTGSRPRPDTTRTA